MTLALRLLDGLCLIEHGGSVLRDPLPQGPFDELAGIKAGRAGEALSPTRDGHGIVAAGLGIAVRSFQK